MVNVKEFKNVDDINAYLSGRRMPQFEIIPIQRNFENPNTKLMTSCMSYILIEND